MLRSTQTLKGYAIQATDGLLGKIEEILFDDDQWAVRYFVVNTGSWLTGKKVLISPIAVKGIKAENQTMIVTLSRQQVKQSPDIDTDKPVSRQMEIQYYDYYHWPYYWTGAGVWGIAPDPAGMLARPYSVSPSEKEAHKDERKDDPHLRSENEVRGYAIEATDARFGQVEDFIIDEESWKIHYLIIDTIKYWPSRSVLISPDWVLSISWADRKLRVNLAKDQIKSSPTFDATAPLDRAYEERLFNYYHRAKYWDKGSDDQHTRTG